MTSTGRWLVVALLAWLVPVRTMGQTAENVAVVINDNSPASIEVGEYYVAKRQVPAANVIHLRATTNESIDRAAYLATIESPIATAILRQGLEDRILYLVLTKGVPLRVDGTGGADGTVASVDSELTLLYRRALGMAIDPRARIPNPYYLGSRPVTDGKPFTHREHDIYLVTRLDAFTVDDAKALIDRALMPASEGRIVLDQQDKLLDRTGENWLAEAAKRLAAQGQSERVLLETTVQGVRDVKPVLGYYSWGSNDPRNRVRRFGLGFVPGSIAGLFVSTDARSFREPSPDWAPSDGTDKAKWFAGSPQSLVGDLIREGVTGVSGHVAEPYLAATVRPEILFPTYVAGLNLVESFYLAMPFLSWQNIVIGDPLCAPFRRRVLRRADLEDGIEEVTQLPAQFAARRIAQLRIILPGVADRAVRLTARSETLRLRGDPNGARAALEEATRIAPTAVPLQLTLAMQLQQQGDLPGAIERYRRVLETQPRHVVALNNLAFAMMTRGDPPAEAMVFARRALAAAPGNPEVIDTVAWIEYLTRDLASASKRIALAVKGSPNNAEIRLHAAAIYAATGSKDEAEKELREAIRLRPSLETSSEAKEIRALLEKPPAAQK